MCLAYLKLHNKSTPKSIKDKREVMRECKNSMRMKSNHMRKVAVEHIVLSLHKMVSQLMTLTEDNINNCKMDTQQYLNESHCIDLLIEIMTN